MKVVHVITGLDRGGAEGVLCRLVTAPSNVATTQAVVSLQGLGVYGPLLIKRNIPVLTLDMPKGRVSATGLWRLYKIMRTLRPDLVQTWMYHSDLIGGAVARIAGVKRIVWGIRHANLDKDKNSRMTLLVARLCALLSRFIPSAIVCCSERAAVTHEAFGYDSTKFAIVPNGYDISLFKLDQQARAQIRSEFGIGEDIILLGCIARWDAQKDHRNLFGALNKLRKEGFQGHCILVGACMNAENAELTGLISQYELDGCVHLLDQRDDIPDIMNAIDINVLSSSGEAFPNVLAEAMACGTPSVTTDVGDARAIVADTGWVVEPQNADALATGIRQAIDDIAHGKGVERAQRCRRRVVGEFQLSKMVAMFEMEWCAVEKRPRSMRYEKLKDNSISAAPSNET